MNITFSQWIGLIVCCRPFWNGLFVNGQGIWTNETLVTRLVPECDENQKRQCATDFVQTVDASNISTMVSKQQIDNVCGSAYPVFKQCLKRSTTFCPSTAKSQFEGMFNMFEFLCNDGREDAIKYSECLGRPIMKSEMASCQSTMQSNILSSLHSSTATKCGYMNTYLDCVKDAVEEECGSDAAAYQDKVTRLATAPIIESIGDDVEINSGSHSTLRYSNDDNNNNNYNDRNNNNNNYSNKYRRNKYNSYDYNYKNGATSISNSVMDWTVVFAVLLQWLSACILY